MVKLVLTKIMLSLTSKSLNREENSTNEDNQFARKTSIFITTFNGEASDASASFFNSFLMQFFVIEIRPLFCNETDFIMLHNSRRFEEFFR